MSPTQLGKRITIVDQFLTKSFINLEFITAIKVYQSNYYVFEIQYDLDKSLKYSFLVLFDLNLFNSFIEL